MAFTGSATIKQIADGIVRVTGLSLAGTASGTIGLFGATGVAPDVLLPAPFNPQPYGYGGATVSLQDSIEVEIVAAASVAVWQPPFVTKAGTTHADFRITVGNSFGSVTPALEMYIKFHE
jgi:hypothetical protein